MPMTASPPPGRRPGQPQAHLVDARPGRSQAARQRDRIAHVIEVAVRDEEEVAAIHRHPPARGLVGLPNHGSIRMVLPPGVVTSTHECPYQVIRRVAIDRQRAPPPVHRSPTPVHSGVPSTQIAQNLPFVNWTVLTVSPWAVTPPSCCSDDARRRPAGSWGSRRPECPRLRPAGVALGWRPAARPGRFAGDERSRPGPGPRATALLAFCGLVALALAGPPGPTHRPAPGWSWPPWAPDS